MKPSRPLFFLFTLLLSANLRAEEWILIFSVDEQKVIESPKGDAPPKTETRNYTQIVALGTDYLAVQNDERKTVYDFANRRMRVANLTTKTVNDWSLYFLPSFSEHELWNLTGLGVAMRAVKSDRTTALFDRFDNETAMRVTTPASARSEVPPPVIETVQAGPATEFQHKGRTAVRFVPAAAPLPAAWHHRFINYLAYSHCIHPDIRRALAGTGAVPQELTVTWRQLNTTTTSTLRLVSSAAATTDSSGMPAGSRPATPPDDPFYAALAKVNKVLESPDRPSRDEAINFAREAVKAKRPLDAVLALVEYGLQSGEQLTDELRRHSAVIKTDAACAAYFSALNPTDKAGLEKQLATNAGIDRRGLVRAHMLDLQRANLLEQAGRPREALGLFLKVVQANPYHTGALHDLGGLFLRNYEHEKAWLCWDAARRLCPGHPMMQDIIRRETDLVRNQPDFF